MNNTPLPPPIVLLRKLNLSISGGEMGRNEDPMWSETLFFLQYYVFI